MDIPKNVFTWPDYAVFLIMLLICIFIGVYFGFIKVSKNVTDYLIGGKSMTLWPVAISLVVSNISGIAFLGYPTEMYTFGIQYLYIQTTGIFIGFISNYIFIPVFMELRLTSTYEYLERRFDKSLRRLGSILFIVSLLIWLPIVIYVPALALNHVTGINTHIITPIVCAVCIFYTCVGGIRAVVWTDFLQAFLMMSSVILVVVKATWEIGGLETVIERNGNSGRLEYPDMELSLTKRLTFPAMLFGGTLTYLNDGIISQVMMQRYVSLPSLKDAKKAVWLFLICKTTFIALCCYSGLVIFASYFNCDPVSTKVVSAKDQLLPLLVIDTLKNYPGTSGLFLAGIFSASLSSLSSGLNSLAAVLLEDCFKPIFTKLTSKQEQFIVKTVVLVSGVLTVGMATIVEKLGQILQLYAASSSISSGPLLGVFILGILFPWANAKGALYAGSSGLVFMGWICFGAQSMLASGKLRYTEKPVYTDGCTFNMTDQLVAPQPMDDYDETNIFYLYRITFVFYTAIGTIYTVAVGLIISYLTGFNKVEDVDPLLLAPFMRPKTINDKPFDNKQQFYDKKFGMNICMTETVDLLNKGKNASFAEKDNLTEKENYST